MAKQASVARIKTETPRGVVLSADISAATSLTPTGAYEARPRAAKRARLFDTHAESRLSPLKPRRTCGVDLSRQRAALRDSS